MIVCASLAAGMLAGAATAATFEDSFEGPETAWQVAESDTSHRVVSHARSRELPHRGAASERFVRIA